LVGASIRLCAHGKCEKHWSWNETVSIVTLRLPDDIGPDLGTVCFQVKDGDEPCFGGPAPAGHGAGHR
jgi:hypothetical protein